MKSASKPISIILLVLLVVGTFGLGGSAAAGSNDSGSKEYEPYFKLEEGGMTVIYDEKISVEIEAEKLLLWLNMSGEKGGIGPSSAKISSADKRILLSYKKPEDGELKFSLALKIQKSPDSDWQELKDIDFDAKVVAPRPEDPYSPYREKLKFEFKKPVGETENGAYLWKIALYMLEDGKEYPVNGSERLIWIRTPIKEDFDVSPSWDEMGNSLKIVLGVKSNLFTWEDDYYSINLTLSCGDSGGHILANKSVHRIENTELEVSKDDYGKCDGNRNKLNLRIKFIKPEPPEDFQELTLEVDVPSPPAQSTSPSSPPALGKGSVFTSPPVSPRKETKTVTVTYTHTEVREKSQLIPPGMMTILSFIALGASFVFMAYGLRSYWDAKDYSRRYAEELIAASLLDNPALENLRYKPASLSQLSVDPIGAIVRSFQEYDSRLSSNISAISRLQSQLRQKELEINNLKAQLDRYRSLNLDTILRDLQEKARRLSSYGPQAQSFSTLVSDLHRVYYHDKTGTPKELEVLRSISSRLDELISLYQREVIKKNQLREAINQKISTVESQLAVMRQKLSSMAQNYHIKLPRSTLKLAETFLERARGKLSQNKFEEAVALIEAAIIVLKELDAQLKNTEYLSMLRILREKFWSV